jgi:hypothetical protein
MSDTGEVSFPWGSYPDIHTAYLFDIHDRGQRVEHIGLPDRGILCGALPTWDEYSKYDLSVADEDKFNICSDCETALRDYRGEETPDEDDEKQTESATKPNSVVDTTSIEEEKKDRELRDTTDDNHTSDHESEGVLTWADLNRKRSNLPRDLKYQLVSESELAYYPTDRVSEQSAFQLAGRYNMTYIFEWIPKRGGDPPFDKSMYPVFVADVHFRDLSGEIITELEDMIHSTELQGWGLADTIA